MSFILPLQVEADARAHAKREFPREACGLMVDGAYLPCFNYAHEPEKDFVIAGEVWKQAYDAGQTVQAVIHSHPNGPLFPSERDMQGQIDTALPWVIIPTDGRDFADTIVWGEGVEKGPLIGRVFRHGVTDCYELVRDTFALGRDGLAAQGVTSEWLLDPVEIAPQARADGWWDKSTACEHKDLYARFRDVGFRQVAQSDVLPGDCFILKLGHGVTQNNHGGVFLGSGLILHHLPTRLSRREPIGIWLRAVEMWLRHESLDALIAAEKARQEQETQNA